MTGAGAAINGSELHNRFAKAIAVYANSYLRLSWEQGRSRSRSRKGAAGKLVAFADCAQSQSETQTGRQRGLPEVTFNAICARLSILLTLTLSLFCSLLLSLITDQKSILTDNDWKKLWMRGGINADSKLDNNLDSSDSPMFEDSEVSCSSRTRIRIDWQTDRLPD